MSGPGILRPSRPYVIISASLVVLFLAFAVNLTRDSYHLPRILREGDRTSWQFVAVNPGALRGSLRVHTEPAAAVAEPDAALPFPGAIGLPLADGWLIFHRGDVLRLRQGTHERTLSVLAGSSVDAVLPAAGRVWVFLRKFDEESKTWSLRAAALQRAAEPPGAAEPAWLPPDPVETVAEGAHEPAQVMAFEHAGAPCAAWRKGKDGPLLIAVRGDDGWTVRPPLEVWGPCGVAASGEAVWVVDYRRAAFRFGEIDVRVRPWDGPGESLVTIPAFRIFGKRVTGVAAHGDAEGIDLLITRTTLVERCRLRREGDRWALAGPAARLSEVPTWRILAIAVFPPLLMILSFSLIYSGLDLLKRRRLEMAVLLNVPLRVPPFASPWLRMFAYWLDLLLLWPLVNLTVEILELDALMPDNPGSLWDLPLAAFLYFAFHWVYFFPLEWAWGQTLGKRLVGIRVVGPDGRPPGAWRAFVRTAARLVDSILCMGIFGLLSILATPRRQRVGDLLAGTTVVPARRAAAVPVSPVAPNAPGGGANGPSNIV